ncbi:SDR family oxidoreductase [Streptomyces sp. NPDC044984]|uniref:SDR family oxidoreductase n=1 Tax=Streptomyces sp. NPDC044984 TaxID=3154335 RepID=UPI0033C13C14
MKRLEGRGALISGTGRGRGRAAALRFAAEGAPHGVRAHCVGPGTTGAGGSRGDLPADEHPVDGVHRHLPLGRPGHPGDAVDPAVLPAAVPASDEAAPLTGAGLVVDGGRSAVLSGAPSRKAIRT